MYRCQICGDIQAPGQSQLRHVLYRPNGQISKEIPVCALCKQRLQKTSLKELRQQLRTQQLEVLDPVLLPPARPVAAGVSILRLRRTKSN